MGRTAIWQSFSCDSTRRIYGLSSEAFQNECVSLAMLDRPSHMDGRESSWHSAEPGGRRSCGAAARMLRRGEQRLDRSLALPPLRRVVQTPSDYEKHEDGTGVRFGCSGSFCRVANGLWKESHAKPPGRKDSTAARPILPSRLCVFALDFLLQSAAAEQGWRN